MSRSEAIKMIVGILGDGSRNDRYLRISSDWRYYTSPDKTFLTNDGPVTPPYVFIPVAYDCSDDDMNEWAESLIDEIDSVSE